MTATHVAFLALLAACTAPPEPVRSPVIPEVPDPTSPLPTADTGRQLTGGDGVKFARELRIVGFIGWNSEEQRLTDIRIGNATYISGFEVQLAVEDGANSSVDIDRCSVVVSLSGIGDSELQAPDEHFRIDIPAGLEDPAFPDGVKQTYSECESRGFTSEQYPEGFTLEDYWASLPWGLAMLSGDLDAELEQRLVLGGSEPERFAQGTQSGRFESERYGHLTYWRAYEMDEFGIVEGINGQITAPRLTRDEMLAGEPGNPPTAYYIFDQLVQWNLPDQITIVP